MRKLLQSMAFAAMAVVGLAVPSMAQSNNTTVDYTALTQGLTTPMQTNIPTIFGVVSLIFVLMIGIGLIIRFVKRAAKSA